MPANFLTGAAAPTFFSLRIQTSRHWPKVEKGTTIERVPAHPIVQWLARFLNIDPWTEFEVPRFVDADPVVDMMHGIIYCSPAQELAVRRAIADGKVAGF